MVIQKEIVATRTVPHIQNQLLFNLNKPSSPSNLAVRFRNPGPVIVERLGSSPTRRHPDFIEHAPPSVQFSVISEESLSMAVKLAKQDIKKKKLELELEMLSKEQEQAAASSRKKKTKLVPSKEYTSKLQQRHDRRRAGKTVQSIQTQVDIKPKKKKLTAKSQPSKPSAARQTNVELNYPPTTDSPPTRDIDNYNTVKSEDEKNIDDICQIRRDLNDCIQKIYQVERSVIAKRGMSPPQLTEEERQIEERRQSHADEKASRTTRLLYGLQQQIREINTELTKSGADGLLDSKKKTMIMIKLAASHRAFLRAIQAFVCNLSEYDIKLGLPRVNKEINYINEQMTACCRELGIGGHSGIPIGVVNVIDQQEGYDRWAREKEVSKKTTKPHSDRWKPIKETVIIGRAHSPPHRTERLCQSPPVINSEPTPERQEAMRYGIAALLRPRSPSPPISPTRKSKPKGLLLPNKSKKEKVRIAIPEVIEHDLGYLEPTHSSQLKTREPHEIHRPDSPKQQRKELTPRSRGYSPRRECCSPISPRRVSSPPPPGVSPRQVRTPRRGYSPRRQPYMSPRHDIDGYLTHLDVGVPREWVADAERAIKAQLKPLIDQAKDISNKNRDPLSLRNKLSEKTSEKVEVNADILGDMILHDLMRDTAAELQKMENDELMEQRASELRNAPQVESLLQRLNEMEREQNAIRQKWSSIKYHDEEKSVKERAKDIFSDMKPMTPQPIHITIGSDSNRNSYQPPIRTDNEGGIELSHLSASYTRQRSLDEFDRVTNEPTHPLIPPLIPFTIHKETLDSIYEYQIEFEKFLKRSANVSIGSFNPWNIVETVSDDIFNDCLEAVTQEIFDAGSAATVEKVFRSEFSFPKTNGTTFDAENLKQTLSEICNEDPGDENDFNDEDVGTEYSETDFDEDDDNFEDAQEYNP